MFLYDVAEVKDMGTSYSVNYVTTNNMVYIYPGKSYVKLSSAAADLIRSELSKGNMVSFNKGIPREILPSDIVSTELRELERERKLAQQRVGSHLDGYLASLSLIDLYMATHDFTRINNKLASKGYFITDENRESKYLEIINTEDSSLIEDLERYLESLDSLNIIFSIYKKYKEFKESLDSASSVEEIREISDKALNSLVDPK